MSLPSCPKTNPARPLVVPLGNFTLRMNAPSSSVFSAITSTAVLVVPSSAVALSLSGSVPSVTVNVPFVVLQVLSSVSALKLSKTTFGWPEGLGVASELISLVALVVC
ncbi:MAG: hypothetical protein FLDDKLPJ_01941 [Phycisphaerae bacterium]|nr:hypothetical protein [Phycisphaerae bacterium]